jgi:hypothetical protein
MRIWIIAAAAALSAGAAQAGSPLAEEKIVFDGVTRLDDMGAPGAVGYLDPFGLYTAKSITLNSDFKVGAKAEFFTKPGYESGTQGSSTASVFNDWNATITAASGTDKLKIANGSLVLHETFHSLIQQTQDGSSAAFAGTTLSYVDSQGVTHFADANKSQFGAGLIDETYNLILPLSKLEAGLSLHANLFESISALARIATNAEQPFAAVDASHTQSIDGFALYDAAGNYIPGFTFTTDDGLSLPEYDKVLQAGAPEPAAWLLMLAGFGLAGAALRRRQAGWGTMRI